MMLSCVGTLVFGAVGGAALAKLGKVWASGAEALGGKGAARAASLGRVRYVEGGGLATARQAFLDPADLAMRMPLAEGAEPSIFDPPAFAPTQVIRPADMPGPRALSGLEPQPIGGGTQVGARGPVPLPPGIKPKPSSVASPAVVSTESRPLGVPDHGVIDSPSRPLYSSDSLQPVAYTQPERETPSSTTFALPDNRGRAWLDNALPVPDPGGRPMISVVIDDLGLNRNITQDFIALPGPLTLSHMAYAKSPEGLVSAGRLHGHEIMLHLPMEPRDSRYNPGPGALMTNQSDGEIRRLVADALSRYPGVVGLNNHMGSKFTADARGMGVVMTSLAERGLMFLDSRTTGSSVAPPQARVHGVPFVERAVFIDHEDNAQSIHHQLAQTEQFAARHGQAVAIGHPREKTYRALAQWLPTLADKGYALMPASAIIRYHV
jgi:polysaccharide deacetylase 2 family uncharacterized protein YibQ